MKALTIHIGAHKTGTTSIQVFLDANPKFLAENGMCYPKISWYHHAQHRIAFAASGVRDPVIGDFPDLEKECHELAQFLATTSHDVILSSELFFAAPVSATSALKRHLSNCQVRIIGCVRRQDNLFSSIYNQRMKKTGNKFTKLPAECAQDPRKFATDLDLLGCLRNWAEVFGRENVTAYEYEAGDSLAQFLQLVKLPLPSDSGNLKRANIGVSPKVLELIRLTKILTNDVAVQNMISQEARKVLGSSKKSLLSPEERLKMLRLFEADNEKLFHEFMGKENAYAAKLAAMDIRGKSEIAESPLNRKELTEVLISFAAVLVSAGISPDLLRASSTANPD